MLLLMEGRERGSRCTNIHENATKCGFELSLHSYFLEACVNHTSLVLISCTVSLALCMHFLSDATDVNKSVYYWISERVSRKLMLDLFLVLFAAKSLGRRGAWQNTRLSTKSTQRKTCMEPFSDGRVQP